MFVKISCEFMIAASDQGCESVERFSALYDTLKCLIRSLDFPVVPFIPLPITESAMYGEFSSAPLTFVHSLISYGIFLGNSRPCNIQKICYFRIAFNRALSCPRQCGHNSCKFWK